MANKRSFYAKLRLILDICDMANVDETIRKISFNLFKLKEMFMFIKNRPTHGITSSLFVLGSLFVFF